MENILGIAQEVSTLVDNAFKTLSALVAASSLGKNAWKCDYVVDGCF